MTNRYEETGGQVARLEAELARATAELDRLHAAESADAAAGSYARRAETAEAERDQLTRDCDARDETIRHLDAGLTHERERVAGLEAELIAARSVVDRVRAIGPYDRPVYGDRGRGFQMGWDDARAAVLAALDDAQEART